MIDVYEDVDLQSGERLLWSGRPQRHPLFQPSDFFMVPMSLVWLAFACFWLWNAYRMGAATFFILWGVPFVLYGVYLVFGAPIVRLLRLRATRYAITDHRVIEIVDWPRRRRTEIYLRHLPPPVHRGEGMVGSVAFGAFPGFQETLSGMGFSTRRGRAENQRSIVLREIAQPRNVRDIIASAQTQTA